MKKQHVDHILRAAGRITGEKIFVIVGSQALHATHPDLADEIVRSAEVDLIAADHPERTDWLNAIGQDSQFHETFGYYADPVDETTAILPEGWRGRLVSLPRGDTDGVRGLCLDPHDLVIAKYAAGREKDRRFNRELARRGIVSKRRLRALLAETPVPSEAQERIRRQIELDFSARRAGRRGRTSPLPSVTPKPPGSTRRRRGRRGRRRVSGEPNRWARPFSIPAGSAK